MIRTRMPNNAIHIDLLNGFTQSEVAQKTKLTQSRISILCNRQRKNSSVLVYLLFYNTIGKYPFLENIADQHRTFFDFPKPQDICEGIQVIDLLDKVLFKKIVGERLAWVRKKRGITWQDMSDELVMTPSYFRNLEEGKQMTTLERLGRICQFLNVSLASILTGFYVEPQKNNKKDEIPNPNTAEAETEQIPECTDYVQG